MKTIRIRVLCVLTALLVAWIVCLLSGCSSKNLVNALMSSQYNSNGISHFLSIMIDRDQPKEYIGDLEEHKVYVENLNIDNTHFSSVDAEKVSIKDALDNELVSIDDWRKYARKVVKDGEGEIFRYENYEIAVTEDECIIRPLSH